MKKTAAPQRKRLLCLNLAVLLLLTTLFCAMPVSALVDGNKIRLHNNIPGETEQTEVYQIKEYPTFEKSYMELGAEVFHRSGFSLVGWSTEEDGSGDWYVPSLRYYGDKNMQLLETDDLYAQWAEVTADSRVFLPYAETASDIAGLTEKYYVKDLIEDEEGKIELPSADVFGGSQPVLLWEVEQRKEWYRPKERIPADKLRAGKVIFSVVQVPDEVYTILDGQGGTVTDGYNRTTSLVYYKDSDIVGGYSSGGDLILTSNLEQMGAFVRDGYVLDSWNTEPDGSGITYYSSEPAAQEAPQEDVRTLYAQWTPVSSDYVCYRASIQDRELIASGRSPETGTDYVLRNVDSAGQEITLPDSSIFTFDKHYYLGEDVILGRPEDLKVIGWQRDRVYDYDSVRYGLGEVVSVGGSTEFHAIWGYHALTFDYNYDAEPTRQVFFSLGDTMPDKAYHRGTQLAFNRKPSRFGYQFQGWNTQQDGKGKMYQFSDLGSNEEFINNLRKIPLGSTLYAQWGGDTASTPVPPGPTPSDPPSPPSPPSGGGGDVADPEPSPEPSPEPAVPEEVVQKAVKQFPDIASHWGKEAAAWAYDKKLFEGTKPNTFAPDLKMDRGMFATVLYRLAEKPVSPGALDFADVPEGAYYADAVAWAADREIITGVGGGKFAPKNDISREELALMLYRFAKAQGISIDSKGSLASFTDGEKVSGWARSAVEWAVGEGLLTGKGGGQLDPRAGASRVEVATILMRFDNP